jgi:hypothetical protein
MYWQRTRKKNNETIMQVHLLLKSETWESVYKGVQPTHEISCISNILHTVTSAQNGIPVMNQP